MLLLRKAISLKMKLWELPFWPNKFYRSETRGRKLYNQLCGQVNTPCLEGEREGEVSNHSFPRRPKSASLSGAIVVQTASLCQPTSSAPRLTASFLLNVSRTLPGKSLGRQVFSLKRCVMEGQVLPLAQEPSILKIWLKGKQYNLNISYLCFILFPVGALCLWFQLL